MKTIYSKIILSMILLVSFTSCDDGDLSEINIDKVRPTSVNPLFQLNQALLRTSPSNQNIGYEYGIVRQLTTPFRGVLEGSNTNIASPEGTWGTAGNWNIFYPNVIKELVDAIANTPADRTYTLSALRIVKAYSFMVLTDTYGDIPYSEAGKGFIEQIEFPKYDSQESVYTDIINELKDAVGGLNSSGDNLDQEILFQGDIDKWKRFGNSLLLRAAMRLSKVDAAMAQSNVQAAVSGGLMESNEDNAAIFHDASFTNPVGNVLNSNESANIYLDEAFVNHLQANNDPRLEKIAVRYVGALNGNDQNSSIASTDPTIQFGLPLGFDQGGFDDPVSDPELSSRGLQSLYDFSQVDRNRVANQQAPSYIVTFSQTMLLLAEARFRGWAAGDAAEAYEAGIRAHMEQFSSYPNSTAVSGADIDAYIAVNQLTGGAELRQINEEYWIASFMAGYDGWANFRRSGFPDLTPNPLQGALAGSSESFIRRLNYTDAEISINGTNVQEAVSRQGSDELSTRVWWDN